VCVCGCRLGCRAREQDQPTHTRPILPCYRDINVGTGPAGRKEAKLPLPSQAQNQHFIHDKEESFVGRKRSFAPSAQQRFFLYVYYPGKQIFGRAVLGASLHRPPKMCSRVIHLTVLVHEHPTTLHDLGEDLFLVGAAKPPTKRKDLPQVYVKVKSICMSR
jgi:hypothetical protein